MFKQFRMPMPYIYDDAVRSDILRMVPQDGKVIGSFGCGRAATEGQLVAAGREVHGVDISEEAIAVAKSRITSARTISPDDFRCFEPNSLDGLIFADVLEHVPQAWQALQQLGSAVRENGWVVISVPNMRSFKVLGQFVIGGDWPEHDTGIYDRTHIQNMSQKRLTRWLVTAGLRPEQWYQNYLSIGRKQAAIRWVDRMTLGVARSWFAYQIQVRARKIAV